MPLFDRNAESPAVDEGNPEAADEVQAVAPPREAPPEPEYATKADLDELKGLLKDLLVQKSVQVAVQAEAPAQVGPAGLPVGLYPPRDEPTAERPVFPRGTTVDEVLDFERTVAEERAQARLAAGLPPRPEPLPEGAVSASPEEFAAPKP